GQSIIGKSRRIETVCQIRAIVKHAFPANDAGAVLSPCRRDDSGFGQGTFGAKKNVGLMKFVDQSHGNQNHSSPDRNRIGCTKIQESKLNSSFSAIFRIGMLKFDFGIEKKPVVEAIAEIDYAAEKVDLIFPCGIHSGLIVGTEIFVQHFAVARQ